MMVTVPLPRVLAFFMVVLVAAQGVADESATVDQFPEGFSSERILSFTQGYPTAAAFAADGRIFVALKNGLVLLYHGDTRPRTFLDLTAETNLWGDRGLLGMAVHPDFPEEPYVYLLHVYDPPELPGSLFEDDGPDGRGARVSRLIRVEADPARNHDVALPEGIVVLLGKNGSFDTIGDPASHYGPPSCDSGGGSPDSPGTPVEDCIPADGSSHSIGTVAFGNDGSLFVGNGDSSRWENVDPRALRTLDLNSLAGKILRIDPETGRGLPDNPFFDGNRDSNRSRVWSYGLRNPFRFAIHPETNEPFIGDAGWESWEELNSGRGANFGWPCYEGGAEGNLRQPAFEHNQKTAAHCAELYEMEPDAVTAPIFSYPRDDVNTAIIAGDFYRGSTYPEEYQGALVLADHNRQQMSVARIEGSTVTDIRPFGEGVGLVVQVLTGPDTNLYYLILGERNELRRLRWTGSGNQPPRAVVAASPVEGEPPLRVELSSEGSFDPDGDPLTYSWDFGDGSRATEPDPEHVYTEEGAYEVELTVLDPDGLSSRDSLWIVVGETAPSVSILSPLEGKLYRIGEEIAFEGRGSDHQDGELTDERFSWELILHHADHIHPDFFAASGRSGTFTVEDHGDGTWLELALTATDSASLSGTSSVAIHPDTVERRFVTEPPGLDLIYQGSRLATPFSVTPPIGAWREIHAPLIQEHLSFVSWSDGGVASHVIPISDDPVSTWSARYTNHPPVAVVSADPVDDGFPLLVELSAAGSSDREDEELSYEWDFGDGSAPSHERDVEHVYPIEGRYRVVLTVRDALDAEGKAVLWIGTHSRRRPVSRP